MGLFQGDPAAVTGLLWMGDGHGGGFGNKITDVEGSLPWASTRHLTRVVSLNDQKDLVQFAKCNHAYLHIGKLGTRQVK